VADKTIDQLTEDLSPLLADYIMTSDQSAGPATRKAQIGRLPIVSGQTAGTPAPDDELVLYDASAGAHRKATIAQVVDLAKGYAELAVTAPAATVLGDTSTFVPIAGTQVLSALSMLFDSPANGQLRYIGSETLVFHVDIKVSMTAASNNQVVEFTVLKNGAEPDDRARQQRKVGTGADVGNAALQAMIELATNDYVELAVRNTTSATNVTAVKSNMFAGSI
jgi:hypothetical protein